jgi:glycosyltransferase involved in cell wall biosynthesis
VRVALVVPGGVDRSGRERVIPALLWLIERLARRHELLVVALAQAPAPARYRLLGADVVNLGRVPARVPGLILALRLRRLLAALAQVGGAFDVLHGLWAGEAGLLAGLAGRLLRTPVLVSAGGGELARLPAIGYGDQLSWRGRVRVALALRLADAITAGSRYALAPMAGRWPDARWVPLGVETGLFAAPVERPAGPPWRLVHAASLNRVKDPETLLRAVRRVADRQPGVVLDWFGTDTLGGEVQRLAGSLDLTDAVCFHGFRPVDELVPFYRRAHLYVQSSLHESQGVAVCEAAAAGVPVVGTAVGLVPELAPEAALAVPPGDAGALAGGIVALLRDPARREAMGRAARAWSHAHDAGWTAAQFESLYAGLCR